MMKKEHLADLNVGQSLAVDTAAALVQASVKMPSYDARARLCVGLACGIAGAMARCVTKHDAVMALKAAINAVEQLP